MNLCNEFRPYLLYHIDHQNFEFEKSYTHGIAELFRTCFAPQITICQLLGNKYIVLNNIVISNVLEYLKAIPA